MESKEVTKKVYFVYCPKCNKQIKGTKPTQVDWNLKIHLKVCEENKNE